MIKNNIVKHSGVQINIITTNIVGAEYLRGELRVHEGSMNETKPQRGYAHFIEHLIFNNSISKGVRCVDAIKSTGCYYNAYTTSDHTSYYIEGVIDKCKNAFKNILKSFTCMTTKTLTTDEFESERNIVLNEIDGYSTSEDVYIACAEISEKYYGIHETIGIRTNIEKATKAKIVKYHNETNLNKRALQLIFTCNPKSLDIVREYAKDLVDVYIAELPGLLRRNHSENRIYMMNRCVDNTNCKTAIFKPSVMHNPELTYLVTALCSTKFTNLKDSLKATVLYKFASEIANDRARDDGMTYGIYMYRLAQPSKLRGYVLRIRTQPNSVEDSKYFINLFENLDEYFTQETLNGLFDAIALDVLKGRKLDDICGVTEEMICFDSKSFDDIGYLNMLREELTLDVLKDMYIEHFKNDMLKHNKWYIISGQ